MILFYLRHLSLLKISSIFLPFAVHNKTYIKKKKGAVIKLDSRLSIGNKKLAQTSRTPSNLYFGEQSQSKFGESVSIGPGVNIIVKKDAQFSIGDSTYITSDTHIEVINSIKIGSDCAISWGITIIDDDHHTIIKEGDSQKDKPSSVEIGNHVWIGCNTTILKNTEIGDNCIIGAGSVVSGVFPANSLIAGNPGKVVKSNCNWQ